MGPTSKERGKEGRGKEGRRKGRGELAPRCSGGIDAPVRGQV